MTSGAFSLPPSPVVMGVLELNAQIMHTDGTHSVVESALMKAEQMLQEGAAIIDVSCDDLRNQSGACSNAQELDLLIPVIEVIAKRISIPVSVDTCNPEVMVAAVNAGAKMINDIHALTKVSALQTAAKLDVHICLMHMFSDPVTKQLQANDKDIVSAVYKYLDDRISACVAEGIERKRILIDPGFGFGKTLAQNLNLLRSLHVFKQLNCPVLVDISHKSMLGQILNVDLHDRIYGTVAAEVVAISRGADIIRSHDVAATADAIRVIKAIAAM